MNKLHKPLKVDFQWPFFTVAFSFILQFFSRLTERFVYGVDVLVDTFWRIWTDVLDVLGIDGKCDVY